MHHLGQIMNKIQRDQKPATSETSRAKALHMILAHSTTKGMSRPPKPPLSGTHGLAPIFTPFKRQAQHPPTLGSKQGHLFLVCAANRVRVKPCLNFSSDLFPVSSD